MSVAPIPDPFDDPVVLRTSQLARELVDLSSRLAAMDARWLALLAEFDRREGWRADGQLSCVDWLVWRCGMTRRTAHDKLRVAYALRRRPVVRESFATGRLSYSKVRAITRITDADEETDRWLLRLADSGTAVDLERVARRFEQLAEQERGVDDYLRRCDRRALRASTSQRRADAAMALARAGRASLDRPGHVDRFTLHVVADIEALTRRVSGSKLIDGPPVGFETLRRFACDCGIVRHLMRGQSEPLDIGTRTRVWTAAQRRSIQVRDGGHCRFPGCHRRTCDCHHLVHHADGGPTAVSNRCLLCPRHHTCLHEGGFTVSGEANGTLKFLRPDGTVVGSSQPAPDVSARAACS